MESNALALLLESNALALLLESNALALSVRPKLKRFRGLSFSLKNLNLELLF